jgi:hypothetical protein
LSLEGERLLKILAGLLRAELRSLTGAFSFRESIIERTISGAMCRAPPRRENCKGARRICPNIHIPINSWLHFQARSTLFDIFTASRQIWILTITAVDGAKLFASFVEHEHRGKYMDYRGAKTGVQNHAKLVELMTAAPMSAEVFAAVQRRRTESRRLIEDLRIAAQETREQCGQYGAF